MSDLKELVNSLIEDVIYEVGNSFENSFNEIRNAISSALSEAENYHIQRLNDIKDQLNQYINENRLDEKRYTRDDIVHAIEYVLLKDSSEE